MSPGGIHRWIVEALGDAEALQQLSPDGFLSPAHWRQAVERTRLLRFGQLTEWDGSVALGRLLADRYLFSEPGQLVHESLRVLPLDRALSAVVMPMSDRLRRSAEFDFQPRPGGGGGFIQMRGDFVVSPAVLLGFYQKVVEAIPGRHRVRLLEHAPELIHLEIAAVP